MLDQIATERYLDALERIADNLELIVEAIGPPKGQSVISLRDQLQIILNAILDSRP